MQSAVPFTRRQQAASACLVALDALFIDAQMELEDVFAGVLTDAEITKRWHRIKTLRHDVETKSFPIGLPFKKKLFRMAEKEAGTYITGRYHKGLS